MRVPPSAPDAAAPDTQTVRCIIAGALGEGREWLNEAEAKQVLAAYGIPILPAEVAADPAAAGAAAARIGGPVALKIRSEEHTSELQSLMRISYAVFCLKNKQHTPHPATKNTSSPSHTLTT